MTEPITIYGASDDLVLWFDGQAHATAALVEQQRIANLIALGYGHTSSRSKARSARSTPSATRAPASASPHPTATASTSPSGDVVGEARRALVENTRDEIRDAVERYGRECQNAVESFRCAEPDLDAVMALIEPHLVIAEAARKWVASRPKGGAAAVAIGGTVHTVATYEQVKAEAALRAAVDAEQVGGE